MSVQDQSVSMTRWGASLSGLVVPSQSRGALILFTRALPSWPKHLPRAPPPNTITLGVRILTYEIWGNINFHNGVLLSPGYWHKLCFLCLCLRVFLSFYPFPYYCSLLSPQFHFQGPFQKPHLPWRLSWCPRKVTLLWPKCTFQLPFSHSASDCSCWYNKG